MSVPNMLSSLQSRRSIKLTTSPSTMPATAAVGSRGATAAQDRQRKVAVKCLELEEILEKQG